MNADADGLDGVEIPRCNLCAGLDTGCRTRLREHPSNLISIMRAKGCRAGDRPEVCRPHAPFPTQGRHRKMSLQNRIVLVTGAGRGLGHSIAPAFADEGAAVVLDYRRSGEGAHELADKIGPERAVALKADVTDRAEVESLFARAREHFGRPVTTVVNNALPDFSFNGDARAK